VEQTNSLTLDSQHATLAVEGDSIMTADLDALSMLLRERADVDHRIAKLIGRPAHTGHIGEYIAAAIFDISLHETATHKGSDGVFNSGTLAGKTVNIKLYSKHAGLLDVVSSSDYSAHPDTYLVMVGGRSNALSSKGMSASVSIEAVYVLESRTLLETLVERGVKLGIATSVRAPEWKNAMVYPESNNLALVLTAEQKASIALFTLNLDQSS
jgi:hypothetical protein